MNLIDKENLVRKPTKVFGAIFLSVLTIIIICIVVGIILIIPQIQFDSIDTSDEYGAAFMLFLIVFSGIFLIGAIVDLVILVILYIINIKSYFRLLKGDIKKGILIANIAVIISIFSGLIYFIFCELFIEKSLEGSIPIYLILFILFIIAATGTIYSVLGLADAKRFEKIKFQKMYLDLFKNKE